MNICMYCQHCGTQLEIPLDIQSRDITCPACGKQTCDLNVVPASVQTVQSQPVHDTKDRIAVQAVFQPTDAIQWPKHCIGCFRENPEHGLPVSVYPSYSDTGFKAGLIIGVIGGGFIGSMVGGFIGGAIQAVGEAFSGKPVTGYYMPICTTCCSRVSDLQVNELSGNRDRELKPPFTVETTFVTRHLHKNSVVLVFRNTQYGNAFHESNPGLVFHSLEKMRKGMKNKTETSIPYNKFDDLEQMAQAVHRLLERHLPSDMVAPNIHPKKLKNAALKCEIPPTDKILGLLDLTAFKSAKECILFTELYLCYYQYIAAPSFAKLPYSDLPGRSICAVKKNKIHLGKSETISVDVCSVTPQQVLALLEALQRLFASETEDQRTSLEIMTGGIPNLSEKVKETVPQGITRILTKHLSSSDVYIAPDIPPKKLKNAMIKCEIPQHEKVLGLIDLTSFGSAKQSLVFDEKRMYFHTAACVNIDHPKTGFILYREFPTRVFSKVKWAELSLDKGQYLNIAGSSAPFLEIFESIRDFMIDKIEQS